ncbi:Crp/Fnr family transcriptional regulator [Pedobacter ginsengiterrae]|uniref:Crp/Fnr family transcriptional regulator n=2 Tax=Pedobacter ginsengiterrae TaxID=871696 RepID=A0ABP7NY06_9SPHI
MTKDSENRLLIQPLINFLGQFHTLSNEFINYHIEKCEIIHVKKNKFILSPIDNNNLIYFVLKGVVRGFVREGQKDITTWFSFENELISAIRQPNGSSNHSKEYLQAVEDCRLICIPYENIDVLAQHYPEANPISRKLLEQQLHAASERSILARIPSAIDRYLKLEDSSMDTNRIPLRHLSSYLGIRLETLSRIRNKSLRLAC